MTKPHCIIHIGMPKTGSSSIQLTLHALAKNDDFEYVAFDPDVNAHCVYRAFSKVYTEQSWLNLDEIVISNRNCLDSLIALLKDTKAKRVLLSSEDIYHLTEEELLNLKALLDPHCQSIHVIGYVRPFVSFVQSALQQVLKQGDTDFHFPWYRKKLEKFDQVFGRENVRLVKFDKASLLKNDVVMDFCGRVGVNIAAEDIINHNQSLSLESVSFLYALNKLGASGLGQQGVTENNWLVDAVLSALGTKKLTFSLALANRLKAAHQTDIEWIEHRLGCSMDEHLPESKDSINSLDDLLNVAVEHGDLLRQALVLTIGRQKTTIENIASWMQLLRALTVGSETGRAATIYPESYVRQLSARHSTLAKELKEAFFMLDTADFGAKTNEIRQKLFALLVRSIEQQAHANNVFCSVDLYKNGHLYGWIINKLEPTTKLTVEIYGVKGKLGEGIADMFRKDLLAVSHDGCCAFSIEIDQNSGEIGQNIVIRVKEDGLCFCFNTAMVAGLTNNHVDE